MGPLTDEMKARWTARQGDIRFEYEWTTLGEYLEFLEARGVSQNVASFLGAGTGGEHVIGHENRPPTTEEPDAMRALADHFGDAGTPDHDPERAAAFSREAAAREAEIGRVRPQRENAAWITDRVDRRNDPGGAENSNDDNDNDSDSDDPTGSPNDF